MSEDKTINMITGEPVVYFCSVCGLDTRHALVALSSPAPCRFEIVDDKCPNEVNHAFHESPAPLRVCVSDMSGIAGKPGK